MRTLATQGVNTGNMRYRLPRNCLRLVYRIKVRNPGAMLCLAKGIGVNTLLRLTLSH